MRSTFSFLFYIKRSNPKKNGNVVIIGRITIDGERAQFSTKLEIQPDQWDNKGGRAKGKSASAVNLNQLLNGIQAKASVHYNRLMDEKGYVLPDKIKDALLGVEEKGKTIIFYFEKYNEQYKSKVGTMTSWTTYTKYELSKNRLIDFLKQHHGINDIPFREMNTVFLQDFYLFLRNTHKSGNNNAMKTMQKLRTVFNYIKNTGEVFIDPYAGFKMSFEKSDRSYLEQDELKTLYSKEFASERLEKVRDVFLFSCYTGISFSDICDLRKENIKQGSDKHLWITAKRNKTGIPFKVRLLNIPIAIMKKYEDAQENGKLLPMISNQNTNDYLHEITNICNINKKITFHVARHTFATLCLTEGMPIESISKLLGHSNIRTTQIYARIIDKKLNDDMNALAGKLNETEELSVAI
ncbi:transposase [Bacteroidia bacterium]|nr:transposase [Bacteroidia bacterium]